MAFGFTCALASMFGVNIASMFDFSVTSIFGFYMAISSMCVVNSASMFACSVASMWPLCSRAT